jgi:hypothetical protein
MKTLYSIIFLTLFSVLGYSQAPEAFNYQAVMRNASGDILTNAQIAVQISILQDSESGTAVYVERFNPTTNDFGLIAIKLGKGTVQSGTFNTIDWGAHAHYIKIEVDPNNGTDFTAMGTTQLLSVPYALYAKSGGGDDADADPANEIQTLGLSETTLSITGGNDVDLSNIGNRTISFPARSLSREPTQIIITENSLGLIWQQDYHHGAFLMIRKPSNYTGGDVEFSILFETTTETAGVVDFFIRPRSVNHGDGFADASSVNSTGISVSGKVGFGTMYEEKCTIPENSFSNDWWILTIQRQGSASTYTDAVIVTSVALSY